MKLNWFSPLPPSRTSIADDYLIGILPALSKNSDVTLWTDQSGWSSELESLAQVRLYRPDQISSIDLNRADVTFYNIGNNHIFHSSIWQVSRCNPGIVILHDFRVHNFFDSLYRGRRHDTEGYLALMKAHYGEDGLHTAIKFLNSDGVSIDTMAERYPFTQLALENSMGVIVHTEEAFEEVQQLKAWPVVHAPLPRSMPPLNVADRKRPDHPPYRLIMFGYMGRNRRLGAVLEALNKLPERECFRLDILGELNDARSVRNHIHKLGLDSLVKLHGYAPEDELNKVLSRSNMAINLRYPTMGEASGSQLRIWYHALPSLVTNIGWYSSLSQDAVAHVSPQNEISDIQKHLQAFLKEPTRFVKMGEEGLQTLRQVHNPENYVRTIIEVAVNASRYRLRKAAYDLARRAGKAMGIWTNDSADAMRVAQKVRSLCGP